MKALVVCPTYGRLPYLGRMLASFLSQTYSDKTLVIVNDDKNVKLACNYDNVVCINLDRKILLPDKRNIGVGLGKYDVYFNHDDDDVFLPNRLSNKIYHHKNNGAESTHDVDSYCLYKNMFNYARSVPPSVCSYTRELFFNVGGYCHDRNCGEDREFFNKIKDLNSYLSIEGEADFVYNWSGVNYHSTLEEDDNYTNKIDEIAYNQLVDMNILHSTFIIEPDLETYSKYLKLEKIFKLNKVPIPLRFPENGKIEIVDF